MKLLFSLILLFFLLGCSNNKTVYWCGDHPCINKKEKEAYFKETMIVEIRELSEKNQMKQSEIEKITQEIIKKEKQQIKDEKELRKQARLEKKNKVRENKRLAKQAKIEEKIRIKYEKELAKQNQKREKKKKKSMATSNKKTSVVANNKVIDKDLVSFDNLVEEITLKNLSRKYPDINDIQK